ncbi:unnamed protein product [Cuscuta epithymum]|uniref:C2H2-type domain-containing protein n=1 Tax=Cuscuta epithymum TaxID=186058 RepID=A0AAV0DF58_9ASTE|nr:unnamed protein product [Cuscuta epithymum]
MGSNAPSRPVAEENLLDDGGMSIGAVAAIPSPPPLPYDGHVCETCGAVFPTERAMFGHLRCHRDRGWRGAYRPPTFSMDEFAEYKHLLVKSEEEQMREIEAERALAAGLVLDRQSPPASEEVAPPPKKKKAVLDWDWDLNVPPPFEESDTDDEAWDSGSDVDQN